MGSGESCFAHPGPSPVALAVVQLQRDCAPVGQKGLCGRTPPSRGSTCRAGLGAGSGADWPRRGGRSRTSAVRAAAAATAHRAEPWPRRSQGRSAGADGAGPGWCCGGSAAHTRTERDPPGPRAPRAPRRRDPGRHDVPGMRLGGGGRRGGGGGGRGAAAPAPGGAARS